MRAARRSQLVPAVLCALLLVVWSPFEPLIAAAGPATQRAPEVGPEFPLQESFGLGRHPAAAFDGTNHLVVWEGWEADLQIETIAASRVAPDGSVLEPGLLDLGLGSSPSVAFDGTNFLIVCVCRFGGIGGIRVSTEGEVLDPEPFTIGTPGRHQDPSPQVAFDGTNFLVTWGHLDQVSGRSGVRAARVTPSGSVLDPDGRPVGPTSPGFLQVGGIAFDGTNYLVVWTPDRREPPAVGQILASRVTPALSVLDPAGIVVATGPEVHGLADVAVTGSHFLAVWTGVRGPEQAGVYAGCITADGEVLDGNGFLVSDATGIALEPTVEFDGTNALVAWTLNHPFLGDDDVLGARVSATGEVLDPVAIDLAVGPIVQESPALSFDGSRFLLLRGEAGLRSVTLAAPAHTPTGPGTLLEIAPTAEAADMAFDGTNHLVVWADNRPNVVAVRVGPSGERLDDVPIQITPSSSRDRRSDPAVSFDGTNFLVVWRLWDGHDYEIAGARLRPDGTVLDPAGFIISRASGQQLSPAVAFDGANHLVVWEDRRTGEPDIWGTRVTPDGAVLGELPISRAVGDQTYPDVASDGATALVVWTDRRAGTADVNSIRVGRTTNGPIGPDGARVPSTGPGIPVSSAIGDQTTPSVASGRGRYFVAWTDRRSGVDADIYASRVGRTNTIEDPSGLGVATAPGDQSDPSPAPGATGMLVVWSDRRSDGADIFAGRLTGGGERRDGDGFVVTAGFQSEVAPAVSRGRDGSWSTVWLRVGGDNGTLGTLFGRTVSPK